MSSQIIGKICTKAGLTAERIDNWHFPAAAVVVLHHQIDFRQEAKILFLENSNTSNFNLFSGLER